MPVKLDKLFENHDEQAKPVQAKIEGMCYNLKVLCLWYK